MGEQRKRSNYGVDLTNAADRDLSNLDPALQDPVLEELQSIGEDPECGEILQGHPETIRSYHFADLPTDSAYRAAYVILDDEKYCTVFAIGPRESFYEKLKRRAQNL